MAECPRADAPPTGRFRPPVEQGRIEFEDPAFRPAPKLATGESFLPAGKLVAWPRKCEACADKDAIPHDLQATMSWMAENSRNLMEYIRALLGEPLSDADRDMPGNERYRER